MVNKRAKFLLQSMNNKILPENEQKQVNRVDMQNQHEMFAKEQNVNTRPAENIRQKHLEREREERQQLEREYYERVLRERSYQRERTRT